MTPLEKINNARTSILLQRSIVNTLSNLYMDHNGKIPISEVKSDLDKIVLNFSKVGIKISIDSIWEPTYAIVKYGNNKHQVMLLSNTGEFQYDIKRSFRSRRLVRTWMKQQSNWKSAVFVGINYYPTHTTDQITINFDVTQ